MATNFLWGTRQTAYNLLTTELNSLASGSSTAYGPEIDNTSNKWQLGDLNFKLASSSSALTGASYCDVYFVISADGTNYPKLTSGSSWKLASANYFAASIAFHPATLSSEVIYECVRGVLIPSAKFKTVLVSALGVTMPSSGNTLDIIPSPEQY